MTAHNRRGWSGAGLLAASALAGAALVAAACGGTSSADKTATASAKGTGSTPAAAATSAATKAATAAASPAATQQAAAGGAAAAVMTGDTTLGKVLTDDKGMTLYVFKNDVAGSGKSACSGGCATTWPAMIVASGAPAKPAGVTGDLATIKRDDGTVQVTYNGMPLYHFINDKAPGDTKGDGVAGVWSVAKP